MVCARVILRRSAPVLASVLLASAVSADPVLTVSQPVPAGGGLVRYDIGVDFQDGLSRSGFIDVSFAPAGPGSFDGASSLELTEWPDIQAATTDPNLYRLQGGTGAGSQKDVVPVASLVIQRDEIINYDARVSRNGQNFVLVPEPGAAVCALLGFATVAALGSGRRRTRA